METVIGDVVAHLKLLVCLTAAKTRRASNISNLRKKLLVDPSGGHLHIVLGNVIPFNKAQLFLTLKPVFIVRRDVKSLNTV